MYSLIDIYCLSIADTKLMVIVSEVDVQLVCVQFREVEYYMCFFQRFPEAIKQISVNGYNLEAFCRLKYDSAEVLQVLVVFHK